MQTDNSSSCPYLYLDELSDALKSLPKFAQTENPSPVFTLLQLTTLKTHYRQTDGWREGQTDRQICQRRTVIVPTFKHASIIHSSKTFQVYTAVCPEPHKHTPASRLNLFVVLSPAQLSNYTTFAWIQTVFNLNIIIITIRLKLEICEGQFDYISFRHSNEPKTRRSRWIDSWVVWAGEGTTIAS